jgi:hypothetical protein
VGALWVYWTDIIKLESEFTNWLTSRALREWNYGTLAQKISLRKWLRIFNRVNTYIMPVLSIPLLLISFLYTLKQNIKSIKILFYGSLLAIWVTCLIFFNLYYVHDYYLIALSPYFAIIFGHGVYMLWEILLAKKRGYKFAFVILYILLMFKPAAYMNYLKSHSIQDANESNEVMVGNYLKSITGKDELILMQDSDWSSSFFYQANRRGLMLTEKKYIDYNNYSIKKIQNMNFNIIILQKNDETLLKYWKNYLKIGEIKQYSVYRINDAAIPH